MSKKKFKILRFLPMFIFSLVLGFCFLFPKNTKAYTIVTETTTSYQMSFDLTRYLFFNGMDLYYSNRSMPLKVDTSMNEENYNLLNWLSYQYMVDSAGNMSDFVGALSLPSYSASWYVRTNSSPQSSTNLYPSFSFESVMGGPDFPTSVPTGFNFSSIYLDTADFMKLNDYSFRLSFKFIDINSLYVYINVLLRINSPMQSIQLCNPLASNISDHIDFINLADQETIDQVYSNGVDYGTDTTTSYYESLIESQKSYWYNAGRSAGYNLGVSEANNYSFLNLLTAVVDAPVKAFKGLFSFEFLGYDMLTFVQFLLTVSLAVAIVRIIFVRKG